MTSPPKYEYAVEEQIPSKDRKREWRASVVRNSSIWPKSSYGSLNTSCQLIVSGASSFLASLSKLPLTRLLSSAGFLPITSRDRSNNKKQYYGVKLQGYTTCLLSQDYQLNPYFLLHVNLMRFTPFLVWNFFWTPLFPPLLMTRSPKFLTFLYFLWDFFSDSLPASPPYEGSLVLFRWMDAFKFAWNFIYALSNRSFKVLSSLYFLFFLDNFWEQLIFFQLPQCGGIISSAWCKYKHCARPQLVKIKISHVYSPSKQIRTMFRTICAILFNMTLKPPWFVCDACQSKTQYKTNKLLWLFFPLGDFWKIPLVTFRVMIRQTRTPSKNF